MQYVLSLCNSVNSEKNKSKVASLILMLSIMSIALKEMFSTTSLYIPKFFLFATMYSFNNLLKKSYTNVVESYSNSLIVISFFWLCLEHRI